MSIYPSTPGRQSRAVVPMGFGRTPTGAQKTGDHSIKQVQADSLSGHLAGKRKELMMRGAFWRLQRPKLI